MNSVNIIGRIDSSMRLIKSRNGRDMLRFIIKIENINTFDGLSEAKIDRIPCFAIDHKALAISTLQIGHRIGISGHLQSYISVDKGKEHINVEIYVDRYDFLTPRIPKSVEHTA